VGFGHSRLEVSGVQTVAQRFQPLHHVLGDAAPVVVAIVRPAGTAFGGDLFESTVTGVIIAPGNGAVPRGNGGTAVAVGNGGMAAFGIVGAIGGHLRDFAINLIKQPAEHFAVAPIGRRHFNADDVLGGLVDGQMNFAPGAALADPVLAHFPFAFTEDLQARRAHHHVRGPFARPTRNFHPELTRTPGHVGVVRYGKVQLAQAHQRVHQPFRCAVGQLEQGLDRHTGLAGCLRVQPGLAPTDWRRGCPVVFDTAIIEPDRQVAPTDQRPVVLRPVRHPIPLLRRRLASVWPDPRCHPSSPPLPLSPDSGVHAIILLHRPMIP